MEIVSFDATQDEHKRRFYDLQQRLYQGDPHFIASSLGGFDALLNPKENPFFRYGKARFFLVRDQGRDVGRIAAFRNPRLDGEGRTFGCLGFFECEQPGEGFAVLLEAGLAWLREQGVNYAVAPMDFCIWNGYRFRSEGFGRPSFLTEPYGKPWYAEAFLNAGFSVERTWISTSVDIEAEMEGYKKRVQKFGDRIPKCRNMGYEVAPLKSFDDTFWSAVQRVTMEAFEAHLHFYPIDEEETRFWYSDLPRILSREKIQVAWKDGRIVGFQMIVADLARAVQAMKGRSHPVALLRFLLNRRNESFIGLYTALEKEAVVDRSGVASWLSHNSMQLALANGVKHFISPLMYEGNRSASLVAPISHEIAKYVLLSRSL